MSHLAPLPQRLRRRELAVGVVILVLILVAAGVLIHRDRAASYPSIYAGPYAPVALTANDTVTMTQPGVTTPVLVIYEDYQCSICDGFELVNGGPIEKLAYQGRVKVIYHMFTIFVGSQPRQANSTRAWAADRCVPTRSWVTYHNLAFGRRIGLASSAFTQCVTSQRYAAQLVPLSNRIVKDGINATPTVLLNGHSLSMSILDSTNGALAAAVRAAH